MKKLIGLFMMGVLLLAVTHTPKLHANDAPTEKVTGTFDDDGWCEKGGVECAYEELPPIDIDIK